MPNLQEYSEVLDVVNQVTQIVGSASVITVLIPQKIRGYLGIFMKLLDFISLNIRQNQTKG